MSDAYRKPGARRDTDDAVEEMAQQGRLRREAERLHAKDAKELERVRGAATRAETDARMMDVFRGRFASRASRALERTEMVAPGVAVAIVLGGSVVAAVLWDGALLPTMLAVVGCLAVVVPAFIVSIQAMRRRVIARESRWAEERFPMMDGFVGAIGASVDKGQTEIFFDVTLATAVPDDVLAKLGDALAAVVTAGTLERVEADDDEEGDEDDEEDAAKADDEKAREGDLRIATGVTDAGLSMGIYRGVVTSFLPLLRDYAITRVHVTSSPRSTFENVVD